MSSPSKPENPPNSHHINHFPPKNSWHSSYAPRRITKAVANKQTRPTRRAFAFNVPPQTVANQRIIRNPNRMTTLQTQPVKAQFSLLTRMFRRLYPQPVCNDDFGVQHPTQSTDSIPLGRISPQGGVANIQRLNSEQMTSLLLRFMKPLSGHQAIHRGFYREAPSASVSSTRESASSQGGIAIPKVFASRWQFNRELAGRFAGRG